MRILILYTLLIISVLRLSAADVLLQGTVRDATTAQYIEFATVTVQPGGKSVATDADGRYYLRLVPGTYTITVSYVGYKTAIQRITISADHLLDINLTEDTRMLGEVVVTAKESTGMTSSSRIDRDAMAHLQPTSFSDLMELLPGNISHDPDMGSVNAIKLRETGNLGANGAASDNPDYNITSLGTLFVVDGAPINGDANMQNVPNAGTDQTSPEFRKDMTNKGVDMRTLSTDNIESVEVVRGIPSAEYGNLTSGMVNIKRLRRATPVTARFKADEYSKLVSIGKGFYLAGTRHIMNIDGGYLDSKVDPRNNLENYKRINLSARLNLRWEKAEFDTNWITGVDYTGSFDNAKQDPDLSYLKVNEYRSSYNRVNYTSDLTFTLNKTAWLSNINLNTSVSYQSDRLERRKEVAPQRASVAPTSMDEGVHDGQYLLNSYIADYVSDGKPLNIFVKIKAEGKAGVGQLLNNYKIGGEWTLSKNYGDGQVYDLTRPLAAAWTTRPRAYKDIPAMNVLSFYVEDNATLPMGAHNVQLQAGLRSIQLVGLERQYHLSGRPYLDPRLNIKWTWPTWRLGGRDLQFYLAAGFGITTKMPTVTYLYPQVHYNDFVQLNYYDVLNPLEHSRISLRTYIDPTVNYRLRPATNRKWEVRLGGKWGKNTFSVTYFRERLRSGYRYSTLYRPYEYTKYDAQGIQAEYVTGPPMLDTIPSSIVHELDGYSQVTNGSRLDKEGIEFTLTTARWHPLRTALTLTGAWFRSTYSNSQMLYQPVSDVVGTEAVRNSYIGYYNCNDGRVNNQLSTNLMFDTQITRWGLVFTTSVQCLWFVSTRRLWQNGVPDSYLDVADGQLHPYTEAMSSDPMLRYLVRTYSDELFVRQTVPTAIYVNLKATKQIGKHLKVAVFANRLIDYLPDYKSNGLTIRRISDPYFGMELNVSL